ncbi:hypothetical protein NDA12_001426 [Ustilago hordei]|nr:hypothetical protein NDA12_001426 [Ustilago hordei]
MAGDEKLQVKAIGDASLQVGEATIQLLDVLYVLKLNSNLFRRVTGSYGRSTGIEDLVEISREHGRSAVSMETMDSYGLTCKGGPSTATRRTKLKEQAQPRRGPSSRSMQMVTTQGLERQEPKELSLIKGEGAVSKESTPGHEEEEQCRRT